MCLDLSNKKLDLGKVQTRKSESLGVVVAEWLSLKWYNLTTVGSIPAEGKENRGQV